MTADNRIRKRSEIAPEDTWNLEAIYPDAAAWDADFARLESLVAPIVAMRGKLDSPAALARVFAAEDALGPVLDKLGTYAHQREDEDTSNSVNQARYRRLQGRMAELGGQTAFVWPEILTQSVETLEKWREDPALADYRRTMTLLIRRKNHTLSEVEETLLSKASEIFHSPYTIFGMLTNADMKFPDVVDDKGDPQPLSSGRFVPLMEHRDRATRKRTFETFYDTFSQYKNTLATTLSTGVKLHNFNARLRKFDSALESALSWDNVPVSLYDTLIESVHEALPAFHEYVALRREVLGVEDLNIWDVYVPIVPEVDLKVSWKDACAWVAESTKPLGPKYAEGVKRAFTERWTDVYENEGKRSGAYSGGCYGTYPYMLMNYQGTLDWVFTLAHELGHSLHSWLSHQSQPYRTADYSILVAEIASTTNEALLHHHLMGKFDDVALRAYLLNHLCDGFRGTVFRQTMFAEFERWLHEQDAAGVPLTAESISEAYYALNEKYYGGAFKPDARIACEWSRVPHFYYNFYVYKYATGYCAAQVFSQRILAGEQGRDLYLDFLRSGGSADPLDQVRGAGVDMLDVRVLKDAFATFRASVAELRSLLVKA